MHTSYFANYKGDHGVSIALWKPAWYSNCISYPDLYPTKGMLTRFKTDGDIARYTLAYYNEVLNNLDPAKVYRDLFDKVLLCYERSGTFCHRHLVAYWIMMNVGVEVLEL